MTRIKLEKVSFIYSEDTPYEKIALNDIDLEIKGGITTGIIGHTGSGKSTLAQLLNGLIRPTSGRILYDGNDIWEKPKEISKLRFKVGLVMQYPEYQLFEETIRADIAYGPKNMGLSEDEIDERVKKAIDFVGLGEEVLDKSPFELSGGQKRRVAIAGIIAMEPEVLLLDEPAAGLDPAGREGILGGIKKYRDNTGASVIIVSHSMEDMAKYCDELIVMNKSEVYMQGRCEEVFSHPEELVSVGLDIPQVAQVFAKLRALGLEFESGAYTVDQAIVTLKKLLLGGESL